MYIIYNYKNISILPILVTADVVGLYPSILHQACLSTLKEALDNRSVKKISTENLVKMAFKFVLNKIVLKNNLFEFNLIIRCFSKYQEPL